MQLLEFLERLVERQEVNWFVAGRPRDFRKRNVYEITSALLCGASPRGVNQNSAHRLGSGGEEVPATVPALLILGTDQAQIRFMAQGRRLQRLAGLLLRELLRGDLAQLVVHERQKLFRSARVPLFDRREDLRDFRHGPGSWKKAMICGP